MTKINWKVVLPIAGIGIIILVVILSLTSDRRQDIDLGAFTEVPSLGNSSITALYGSKYYFSNDRYLVAFDTKTGQTQQLTGTFALPRVDDIKPTQDGKFVAFKTIGQINQTEEQDLDSYFPTWWVANTTDGSVKKISDDSNDLVWTDNQKALVSVGSSLGEYDTSSQQLNYIYENAGIIDSIYGYSDSIIFRSGKVVSSLDKKSLETTTIAENSASAIFSSIPGCNVIGVAVENSEFSEYTIRGCGEYQDYVIDKYIESPMFSSDGKILVYITKTPEGETAIEYIDLENKQSGNLNANQFEDNQDVAVVSFNSIDSILLSVNNTFYAPNSKPYATPSEPISASLNGASIDFSPSSKQVFVSKNTPYVSADRLAIENFLKTQDVNPHLVLIDFIQLTDDRYRWD